MDRSNGRQRFQATGYRKRSRSRNQKHDIRDRSVRLETADVKNTQETPAGTAEPTTPPGHETLAKEGGATWRNRFYAVIDGKQKGADNAKTDSPFTAPGTKDDGKRGRRKIETEPFQSLDEKVGQKNHVDGRPRKIVLLANSPKHRNAEQKEKPAKGTAVEDDTVSPGRSSCSGSSSSDGPTWQRSSPTKWRAKGDQGIEKASSQKSCGNSDTSANSSARSCISPMSANSTSTTDWEDRFVVDMPSAKEPNPPMMTAKQISDFQSSIQSIHREGVAMLDPETLPSPTSPTPGGKSGLRRQKRSAHNYYNVCPDGLAKASGALPVPSSNQYYSPAEVGKSRSDMEWEESASEAKEKAKGVNFDGSFLGCKEMNGPGDKNPEEILLFSPREENPRVTDISSPTPKIGDGTKEPTHSSPSRLEEKTAVHEDRDEISRNMKPAPCSRLSPKTTCHESEDQRRVSPEISHSTPDKENSHPAATPRDADETQKDCQKEDDVFIITPTIRRTMITVGYIKDSPRNPNCLRRRPVGTPGATTNRRRMPRMASIPSGLQPGTQTSQMKSTAPSKGSSKADPIRDIPVIKVDGAHGGANIDNPQGTRGYTHTPGMVKSHTENFAGFMQHNIQRSAVPENRWRADAAVPGRSFSDSSQSAKPCRYHDLSPLASPKCGQQTFGDFSLWPSKNVPLAELDGHQVKDHNQPLQPHSRITDLTTDLADIDVQTGDDNSGMGTMTLSLVFNILIVSVVQVHRLYGQYMTNRYVKAILQNALLGAEKCFHLLKRMLVLFSIYRPSGSWSKSKDQDLGGRLIALGQAVVNIIALGFFMIVLGRLAWYMVLIGSWIVWLAKPFGWLFSVIGRMVQA